MIACRFEPLPDRRTPTRNDPVTEASYPRRSEGPAENSAGPYSSRGLEVAELVCGLGVDAHPALDLIVAGDEHLRGQIRDAELRLAEELLVVLGLDRRLQHVAAAADDREAVSKVVTKAAVLVIYVSFTGRRRLLVNDGRVRPGRRPVCQR